ncbi:MAG: peroxide stress protein YaaA [Rhodospirillales bacterium]|nr:peroxide stress protein YaaA [Rhodospirillales bacterium]
MLAVISPAKKLDFETEPKSSLFTQPAFLDRSEILVEKARRLSRADLGRTMKLSDKLAELNFRRFQDFSTPFTLANAKQAALVFNGDTYVGLDATTLDEADLDFAQDHLRILSGLYGVLRPLDLIQPYRLEMGARFQPPDANNLYEFWDDSLARAINAATDGHKDRTLINLASVEYFKAVDQAALDGAVITPVFKEVRDGVAKVLGLFAKRARGAMARYIVRNRLQTPDGIKAFDAGGYQYQPGLSDTSNWVFTREQTPPAV